MKFHYRKAWGIIFIILGLLITCVFCSFEVTGKSSSAIGAPAFVLFLFGILFLTRPYFILNDSSLVLCGLLGFGNTTYQISSIKELIIEKNNIYLNQNGKRQKINISIGMIDKKEWQAFLNKYEESGFKS